VNTLVKNNTLAGKSRDYKRYLRSVHIYIYSIIEKPASWFLPGEIPNQDIRLNLDFSKACG
jgi:hypothetical protein